MKTLAIVIFIFSGFFTCKAVGQTDYTDGKSNFLIIVSDDQGYADLSAYPHSAADVRTPHLDRLSERGILFTRFYAAAPVCSPSRAGLFSGRYPQQWGGWRYKTGLPDSVKTFAEYFAENGYSTGMIGKSDWGKNHNRNDVREFPLNHGYQYFFGFCHLWHDYFLEKGGIPDSVSREHAPIAPLFYNMNRVETDDAYTTTLFTDSAIAYVERNRDRPFMLTLSYNAVHDLVQQVPDAYLERFDLTGIPRFNPDEEDYMEYYKRFSEVGETSYSAMREYYLANLSCLDDNIGRLMDALDKFRLTDNTVIIYMGDNGGSPQSGAVNFPLSGSKYLTLEGGLRVPFIMKLPSGFTSGILCNEMMTAYDILPGCMELAGIEIPRSLDGISIIPFLKEGLNEWTDHPVFFAELNDQFAVIAGEWKLTKSKVIYQYYGGTERVWPAVGEEPRLFNLREDPGEHIDLSVVETVKYDSLMQIYQKWHQQMHKGQDLQP